MSITLTTMRYFLEVAKHESFSAAANRLYTAQPNLSKAVSGLERSLGVELFHRDGRYVRLTDAGRFLYQEWSAALERIDLSVREARRMEQARMDSVTVGVLEGMAITAGVSRRFEEIRARGGVELRLERGGTRRLWQEFDAGRLDMIVTCQPRDSRRAAPPFCARRVVETCCGAIAIHIRNPLAERGALTLPMLREEDFVILSREEAPEEYRTLQALCRRAGFVPRITREAPSIETLLLYVEAGIGVAILGGNNRLISNPEIRLLPLEDILFDVAVYWHPDSLPPAVRAMADAM